MNDELINQRVTVIEKKLENTATKEDVKLIQEISSLKVWFAATTLTVIITVVGVGFYFSNQLLSEMHQLKTEIKQK